MYDVRVAVYVYFGYAPDVFPFGRGIDLQSINTTTKNNDLQESCLEPREGTSSTIELLFQLIYFFSPFVLCVCNGKVISMLKE